MVRFLILWYFLYPSGSADAPDGKRTACYDLDVEIVRKSNNFFKISLASCFFFILISSLQDDPVRLPMHSFLMSSVNHQEILTLDTKVGVVYCMWVWL